MLTGLRVFIALAVISFFCWVLVGWMTEPGVKPVPPHPLPWSCQQAMNDVAPVDGGGQIAPLCGATPYPADPDSDGDAT